MRNLMVLRFQIVITFCFIAIIGTGCAATYQKVDDDLLEQNKSKVFKIGIVKIVGDPNNGFFGLPDDEYKKKALANIPISEICSILSDKYSITIDPAVDKTTKGVKEGLGSGRLTNSSNKPGFSVQVSISLQLFRTENAYYGNLEYKNASTIGRMFGSSPRIINNNEFPDVVNLTYSVKHGLLKEIYYYDIIIASAEQNIIQMHGTIASIATPHDNEAIWNLYVDTAGRISEALKRDLFQKVDTTTATPATVSAPSQDASEALKRDMRPF